MNKLLMTAAALLVFTVTAVSAGTVKLPEEFLGTWCIADRNFDFIGLQRTGCRTRATGDKADEVVIRQDSLDLEGKCKLIKSRRIWPQGNADTFAMFYRCGTGKQQHDWHVEMVMKHGDLFLNHRHGK